MASRGHRVIACAQSLLPGDKYPIDHAFSKNDGNYPAADYCFVGLVSLEDPPKHGVREAIGTLSVTSHISLQNYRTLILTLKATCWHQGHDGYWYVMDCQTRGKTFFVYFLSRRSPQDRRSYCQEDQSNFRRHEGDPQREDRPPY
jgi:hypothetical protein